MSFFSFIFLAFLRVRFRKLTGHLENDFYLAQSRSLGMQFFMGTWRYFVVPRVQFQSKLQINENLNETVYMPMFLAEETLGHQKRKVGSVPRVKIAIFPRRPIERGAPPRA